MGSSVRQGGVTYRQQRKYCGKARCRKCREGIGHGPYWFAYRTEKGKTIQTYIGKELPSDIQALMTQRIETPEQVSLPLSPSPGREEKASSRLPMGRAHQRPFVGREQEQQSVSALIEQVEHQRSQKRTETLWSAQCLLFTGAAGLGKTRLAEEASHVAQQRGWTVVWGRAYAQEGTMPYHLWIELLRKALSGAGKLPRKMLAHQGSVLHPLLPLLPELNEVLPLPPATAPIMPVDYEQHRLCEAIVSLLKVMSERTPLLIVLDDLQWSDESSCRVLAYVSRRLQGEAIAIIGTCRDDELDAHAALRSLLVDLYHDRAVMTLPIHPLSDEQIGTILFSLPALPEMVVRQIQAKAAGNPLFAEELARAVVTPSPPLNTTPLPEAHTLSRILPDTITAVLEQRLSRLSAACQHLLSRAAILGESFEFDLLQHMAAGASASHDEHLLSSLEEALHAGVLTEERSGTRISYCFWHPLLVSHLTHRLSAARRMNLHLQAAQAVQQAYQGREDEGATAITYHLVQGGASADRIAHVAARAGDYAYRLSAYPEAERLYRIVLDLGKKLALATDDQRQYRVFTLERLGECLMIQGNYEEARQVYERMLDVCTSTVWHQDQYGAQVVALAWSEIGQTWRYEGNYLQAEYCYERGEQILQKAGILTGSAWAILRYQQGYLRWQQGRYQEASVCAESTLALFEGARVKQQPERLVPLSRIQRTLAGDPVDLGRIHTLLAEIAATVGQSAEATAHYTTALSIFEQGDRQREIASVACNLGDLYLRRAEHVLAQSSLRRALGIAEHIGDLATRCVAIGNLGVLARRLGNLVEAEACYTQAITIAEQITDPIYISLWHSYLAAVLHEEGKHQEAGTALRRALTSGRTIAPCFGFALMTLGSLRINQARTCEEGSSGTGTPHRFALHAQLVIRRALALEGIEAETQTEGGLTLAQIFLFLGDLETAQSQAKDTLLQARRTEQKALCARAEHLLGSILAGKGEDALANACFDQALQFFRESGMRLELARTLQTAGMVSLHNATSFQRGLSLLQEARSLFDECHAHFDLSIVERVLSTLPTQANT